MKRSSLLFYVWFVVFGWQIVLSWLLWATLPGAIVGTVCGVAGIVLWLSMNASLQKERLALGEGVARIADFLPDAEREIDAMELNGPRLRDATAEAPVKDDGHVMGFARRKGRAHE